MDERVSKLQGDLQNLVQFLVEGLKNQLSAYGVDAVEYTVLSVCMAVGPTSIRDLRELVPLDYGHLESHYDAGLRTRDCFKRLRLEE